MGFTLTGTTINTYDAYYYGTYTWADPVTINTSILGDVPSSIDYVNAGNGNYEAHFINLQPNWDYTVIISANGESYTYYFHTPSIVNWEWYTPKVSGGNFTLTAAEWNDFTNTINTARLNKSLSAYSFTTVPYGDGSFYAWIFNQAVTAINDMSPPTSTPSTVVSGQDIYASYLNGLRDSLNSIS